MKKILIASLLLIIGFQTFAQEIPTDFLPADFHKERRQAVRKMMPPNTVAVFFANPKRNRANDVDYIYHQDPDFYYLTGYKEPNAVLLIFSGDQEATDGVAYNETLYVQKRDARSEQWNGKRLGVEGAKKVLGFERAFNGSEFAKSNLDFKKFDKVLFFD
ncbi:MAG: aminopeptidase P N-terminal domain-containing protein, partial [Flavobacteriaceae bacterium]